MPGLKIVPSPDPHVSFHAREGDQTMGEKKGGERRKALQREWEGKKAAKTTVCEDTFLLLLGAAKKPSHATAV